jgi:tRNA A-37 threonylcarbamoyl transferase component Bud32
MNTEKNKLALVNILGLSFENVINTSLINNNNNNNNNNQKNNNNKYDESKKKKQDGKIKKKFLKSLSKGSVEKKCKIGNISNEEIDILIEIATKDESIMLEIKEKEREEMNLNACISLATLAYPVERISGIRTKILNNNLLNIFLNYAREQKLSVHLEIPPSEIEKGSLLAEGASAKVFKAKWKGKDVALKVFDPEHISFSYDEFRRELALLVMLENDNLVPCYGACTQLTNGSLYIISEIMTKGNLKNFIKEMKKFIDLKMILRLTCDIVKGMKWLHSLNIIHRDLKSFNILVNSNMKCKIIDFGTSRVVDHVKKMTGNLGTPAWMAPEVLTNAKYSQKADVYSFGIVMWELLTGEEPFHDMKTWAIPDAVISGKRPPIPKDVDKIYVAIMEQAWHQEPEMRPTFEQLDLAFEYLLKKYNL